MTFSLAKGELVEFFTNLAENLKDYYVTEFDIT